MSLIESLSFLTGRGGSFPDNLKVVNLIPIFKKDDPTICNSYSQPISLLSNISKIIEKLIHARLTMFLNEHNTVFSRLEAAASICFLYFLVRFLFEGGFYLP